MEVNTHDLVWAVSINPKFRMSLTHTIHSLEHSAQGIITLIGKSVQIFIQEIALFFTICARVKVLLECISVGSNTIRVGFLDFYALF